MTDTSKEGIKILKASYGTGTTWTDVTEKVKPLIQDDNLNFTVGSETFGILDPAPGVKKTFQAQISINGGKPTLFTKEDSQIFDLNVPVKKDKVNNTSVFGSSFFYFLVSILALYFSYSAYKFGALGLGRSWLGYVLGALVLGTFISFGAADAATGIVGLMVSTPMLSGLLPLIVFLMTFIGYHFYNNSDWINFAAINPPKIKI